MSIFEIRADCGCQTLYSLRSCWQQWASILPFHNKSSQAKQNSGSPTCKIWARWRIIGQLPQTLCHQGRRPEPALTEPMAYCRSAHTPPPNHAPGPHALEERLGPETVLQVLRDKAWARIHRPTMVSVEPDLLRTCATRCGLRRALLLRRAHRRGRGCSPTAAPKERNICAVK